MQPTITLSMIAYLEQDKIIQCLESAKDAFDHLSLTIAVGSSQEDSTAVITRDWCQENKKGFVLSRYRNLIDPQLPHTDDFSAARNLSLSNVLGDFWFWLDCDDYLEPPNALRIREAARTMPPDKQCAVCDYRVDGQDNNMPRERLFRRGVGHWEGVVHENCASDADGRILCPQIVIFHHGKPLGDNSSLVRNLAILERQLKHIGRTCFYACDAYQATGDKKKAGEVGRAALMFELPDLDMRYVTHCNLAACDRARRDDNLTAATRLQPWRREAWAYLCLSALERSQPKYARAYLTLLKALPTPSPVPWTHQAMWYSWGAVMLEVHLLRLEGLDAEADALHDEAVRTVPGYVDGTLRWGKMVEEEKATGNGTDTEHNPSVAAT